MTTTDKKKGLKRPGVPVDPIIKKSVARAFRHGKFGSRHARGISVDVGYIGGIEAAGLAAINPNSVSTIGNGAWCWNVEPDHWFESYVPKPHHSCLLITWTEYMMQHVGWTHWPDSVLIGDFVEAVNTFWQRYDSCDDG